MDMTWSEAYDRYNDMLDEIHGTIYIGILEYSPSKVLREVDPIAYRCGFNDWADGKGIDTDDLIGPDDN